MDRKWYSWWADSLGFDDSKYADDWGYKLKATRCPEAGLLEPCPDSLTRKVCPLLRMACVGRPGVTRETKRCC